VFSAFEHVGNCSLKLCQLLRCLWWLHFQDCMVGQR
jgi:hypothetical protein